MNPFFEVVHEYGWDLKDLGAVQVLTDRKDNIIRSLNHDDIEYLKNHGINYNPKTDQFEIPTNEFFERGFHPEAYESKDFKKCPICQKKVPNKYGIWDQAYDKCSMCALKEYEADQWENDRRIKIMLAKEKGAKSYDDFRKMELEKSKIQKVKLNGYLYTATKINNMVELNGIDVKDKKIISSSHFYKCISEELIEIV